MDKLETLLQHTQGLNPPDFDYAFNLAYGKTHRCPTLVRSVAGTDRSSDRAKAPRRRVTGVITPP